MMYRKRMIVLIVLKMCNYIIYYNFRFGKLISKYSIFYQVKNINLIILCEAYEVLSDPLRRAVYDQYGNIIWEK